MTGQRGLLIVFSGGGKGKTTAALGMAIRASGHDMRVLFVQLLKGAPSGELTTLKRDKQIQFVPMAQGYQLSPDSLTQDRELAMSAWRQADEALSSGNYDIVVLDDLNFVLSYDLIPLDDVLHSLRRRPAQVHVVITGRNAPAELLDAADLVTMMKAVKHPFMQGVAPQAGIEF